MKLNLGVGEFPIKGFVNIDVYEHEHADLICNAIKLPYEDNSIEEIYAGHILEHFPFEEAKRALKEWFRILKPNAQIGIVVPDKDNAPGKFVYAGSPERELYANHNSYWNYEMLKEELSKVGFEYIEKMNIDTYPHLVARPKWQVGVVAIKGGTKMKKEKTEEKEVEIPKFNEREFSWCKHEKKVVYNPTKKKHCPQCRRLL